MPEGNTTMRPPLEAVFFDAGGTLVRLDFEWIAELLAGLGVATTTEDLRRAEVLGRRLYDLHASGPRERRPGEDTGPLGGSAPTSVYWSGMLEGVGCRHPLLEEALAAMWARQASEHFLWSRPNEGARDAIDGVLALGLRAACVSNSDGRAEAHLIHSGVRAGLEFVMDSAVEGIEKPDPEILWRACRRMGVAPGRSLFVGDIRSVDEAGAHAAGMHFTLVDPFGDYAGDPAARVARMDELPGHVAARFATPVHGIRTPQ